MNIGTQGWKSNNAFTYLLLHSVKKIHTDWVNIMIKNIVIPHRKRIPGFSDCNMKSLKRLKDWCLYNVPTYKVSLVATVPIPI